MSAEGGKDQGFVFLSKAYGRVGMYMAEGQ